MNYEKKIYNILYKKKIKYKIKLIKKKTILI